MDSGRGALGNSEANKRPKLETGKLGPGSPFDMANYDSEKHVLLGIRSKKDGTGGKFEMFSGERESLFTPFGKLMTSNVDGYIEIDDSKKLKKVKYTIDGVVSPFTEKQDCFFIWSENEGESIVADHSTEHGKKIIARAVMPKLRELNKGKITEMKVPIQDARKKYKESTVKFMQSVQGNSDTKLPPEELCKLVLEEIAAWFCLETAPVLVETFHDDTAAPLISTPKDAANLIKYAAQALFCTKNQANADSADVYDCVTEAQEACSKAFSFYAEAASKKNFGENGHDNVDASLSPQDNNDQNGEEDTFGTNHSLVRDKNLAGQTSPEYMN